MGPARDRIVSLQILRFAAAMMIVIFHTMWPTIAPWYRSVAELGAAGVDIFFVLSGLVIALTGPLAEPRPTGAAFFWRRWRRVAPIYFILSLPIVIASWRLHGLSGERLAATFLFWAPGGVLPYLSPGWTLCLEMIFYSMVALLLTGGRMPRNLTIGAVVLMILIAARAVSPDPSIAYLVNPLFLEFAAGVLLATQRARLMALDWRVGAALGVAGVSAVCAQPFVGLGQIGLDGHPVGQHAVAMRIFLFGVPAAMIVAGALICESRVRGRLATLLAKGGDASYSIYLTHYLAINIVGAAWLAMGARPGGLLIAAVAALSVAIGLACHHWVETPILRDLKKLRAPSFNWRFSQFSRRRRLAVLVDDDQAL